MSYVRDLGILDSVCLAGESDSKCFDLDSLAQDLWGFIASLSVIFDDDTM